MFHFVANLKTYTFLDTRDEDRFDAYLLSADYASAHAELAAVVREQQRLLVADNGNMDSIRALMREFANPAAELDSMRKDWEKTAGHYARPSQLPKSLRRKFRNLAAEIVVRSEALTSDSYTRDAVQRQVAINPTMLVGMEDLAVGTMGALNIERGRSTSSPSMSIFQRSFSRRGQVAPSLSLSEPPTASSATSAARSSRDCTRWTSTRPSSPERRLRAPVSMRLLLACSAR